MGRCVLPLLFFFFLALRHVAHEKLWTYTYLPTPNPPIDTETRASVQRVEQRFGHRVLQRQRHHVDELAGPAIRRRQDVAACMGVVDEDDWTVIGPHPPTDPTTRCTHPRAPALLLGLELAVLVVDLAEPPSEDPAAGLAAVRNQSVRVCINVMPPDRAVGVFLFQIGGHNT